jgi:glyoxylase-like metal-dependent hydrolase (beta-lactamase superfamily II)
LVQPNQWWAKLPRPGYASLNRVGLFENWFEVYELQEGTFAIYEPYQFQEAISYLLVGNDKAVLIDSGNGIGNIAKVTAKLTDLPVTALLTHEHADHFGGSHRFDTIGIRPVAAADATLRKGVPNQRARRSVSSPQVWKPLPRGVDPETFAVPPVRANMFLADGQIIDLGGRRIEVIFTPGHSAASVCFLDLDRRLLATGDHYYPGPLYAHSAGVDIDALLESNLKLVARIGDFDHVLPGHNEPWIESAVLTRINPAFATIFAGGGEFSEKDGLRRYRFDGFEVLIRGSQVK